MRTSATLRFARISAQKARLVSELMNGRMVESALAELAYCRNKAAPILKKVLESAIANAEFNDGADVDSLRVVEVRIDEGPTMKRLRARAKGRAARIKKRTSHVNIVVAEV